MTYTFGKANAKVFTDLEDYVQVSNGKHGRITDEFLTDYLQ